MLAYVYIEYVTHNGMRVIIGGFMTSGWGVIYAKLYKQKLNTKKLTESEVVVARYCITFSICLAMYMGYQGYIVKRNQLIQDNRSAIKWRIMVKTYVRGVHINIKYFSVKGGFDKKYIKIIYCTTKVMLDDYLTNHKRGDYFICL